MGWATCAIFGDCTQVLRGLVAGEQPSAEVRSVVRRLVRKEVLEQKEGAYGFQVPLVEAFVREKVLDE